jgi:hypothetical protein
MRIKIYTKEYTPLTTLFQSRSASDYNTLSYRETLNQVGDASFTMRLDSEKATEENLKHYNIVEITEEDDTPRWVGVIVYKRILFNTVNVTCYSLMHLLTKRLTPDADAHNDTAGAIATDLLSTTNGLLDTEIVAGTLNDPTAVQITFNRATVYEALKSLSEASGGQFRINPDRTLDFKASIGTDKSASVILQYRIELIAASNILTFQVEDDAKSIVTRTYGFSDPLSSDEEDLTLSGEYGLLEQYKNFREINDQPTLDGSTAENNKGPALSPLLNLSPDVEDTFDVGDTVKVILRNRLVEINDNYQVTEKTVKIQGGNQREISLRVISNPPDFFSQIKDIKSSVDLLVREV